MKDKHIFLMVGVILLFSTLITAKAQPPMPPCSFFGSVKVNGSPAPDGLNVTIVIRGTTLKWSTETKDGAYGPIEIPSDNMTTPEKDGGKDGDVIEFCVKGIETDQTETFAMAEIKKVDLSIFESEIPDSDNPYPFDPIPIMLVVIALGLVAVFLIYKKRK